MTELVDITGFEITGAPEGVTWVGLLNSYALFFGIAFTVTLFATPLMRRIAIATGVIDRPDRVRKLHEAPVAYLGGVAVMLGLLVAIAASFVILDPVTSRYDAVPMVVIFGMFAIGLTGLADDLWKWDPRLKIAGQLVAAAALAYQDIGVGLVAGIMTPLMGWVDPVIGTQDLVLTLPMGLPVVGGLSIDFAYWVSTAILAVLVLGACNAANFIDGLDGLLSGTVAIVSVGLIAICMLLALTAEAPDGESSLIGARLVLAFALFGAVLGFLPHNFNPAAIFLGDAGSLLLGYMCITIIIMLGEHAQTHLVFAGLIIFALPIMDATLAIIRRRLAGRSMSVADDQHIHHQLRRSLGSVKRAVFTLYGITAAFTVLGVTLAYLVILTQLRVRVVYVCAFVLFSFIGVVATKAARREQLRRSVELAEARAGGHTHGHAHAPEHAHVNVNDHDHDHGVEPVRPGARRPGPEDGVSGAGAIPGGVAGSMSSSMTGAITGGMTGSASPLPAAPDPSTSGGG